MLATVTSVEGAAQGRTALGAKLVVRPDGRCLGTLGDAELDRIATRDALAALDRGVMVTRHYGPHGEARREEVAVFMEVFAPPARLDRVRRCGLHQGACRGGKGPRFCRHGLRSPAGLRDEEALPTRRRGRGGVARPLPRAGRPELGPRDAVCVLTHDTKFDVPAILGTLRTRAGYLGAMGSRRTHERRWQRLVEAGADEAR